MKTGTPLNSFAIWLIRGYQRGVSPALPRSCRFEPSCSQYSIEAFRRRNVATAAFLTSWRLLRCNPFNKGGFDPVDNDARAPDSTCQPDGHRP